jgi:hypothetical protein
MSFEKISSTYHRFLGLFKNTTVLDSSSEIFGGLSADASTIQFIGAFVSAGGTAQIKFLGNGLTDMSIVLPAGFHKLYDGGYSLGPFEGCTGVSITTSSNSILEFKGGPRKPHDYFSVL